MIPDAFISYSTTDKDIADQVCKFLEEKGIRCWIAPRNIPGGATYAEAIIDAIKSVQVLVLILSKDSNESGFVMREVERAFSGKIAILPFRVDNVQPAKQLEFFISAVQWLDAGRPPQQQHLEQLTDSVRSLLHNKSEIEPEPQVSTEQIGNPFIWDADAVGKPSYWLKIIAGANQSYYFYLLDPLSNRVLVEKSVPFFGAPRAIILSAVEDSVTADEKIRRISYARVGNLLYRSLLPIEIQNIIDMGEKFDVVLGTDDLTLPWEWLHDGANFICLRKQCSRIPETFHWVSALFGQSASQTLAPDKAYGVLLIADPMDNLPSATEEARILQQLFEKQQFHCEVLVGSAQCTYLAIMNKLKSRQYGLVHIISTMRFLSDRGTGALLLPNQQLLAADEICSAFRGSPLVFLDGRQPFDEFTKHNSELWSDMPRNIWAMMQAFISGQPGAVRSFIGSLWRFHSFSGPSQFSTVFYKRLLAGDTVGESLRLARQKAEKADPNSVAWCEYALFGDPNLHLQQGDKSNIDSSEQAAKTPSASSADPPWSKDIQVAIYGALASMSAMNWPVLSTIHLLLGLTYLPQGLLSRTLAQSGRDPNQTRRESRKKLQLDKASSTRVDFGLSRNLAGIFESAKQLALQEKVKEIEEKHLLVEILHQTNTQAAALIRLWEVEGPLREAIGFKEQFFLENGEINPELFEKPCLEALKNAAETAALTHWDHIRSPHIFLGLLARDGGILAERVRKLDLCFSLTDKFHQSLQKPPQGRSRQISLSRTFFSSNALQILRAAYHQTEDDGRLQIQEDDLLESILSDEHGFVVMGLKKLGINTLALKSG